MEFLACLIPLLYVEGSSFDIYGREDSSSMVIVMVIFFGLPILGND